MNEGDDIRLEDWFLRFMLENSQELEEIIESKIDGDGFLKIKQDTNETLIASGTGDDGESDINIYVNLGGDDKRFVAKIQDLIAKAENEKCNYIICIGNKFDDADVEELMQDVVFYLEKCVHLIFLTVDFEEGDEDKSFNIKQEAGIRVYNKTY